METLIVLPGYITPLVEEMRKYDFLVHNFPLANEQSIYSPCDYLYNKMVEEVEYQLVIDTNILHFLLKSAKGVVNEKTRAAVGLVAFCQVAKIDIDPTMAVYELISYEESRAQEAVEKLLLFDKINNADSFGLAGFCLEGRGFQLPEIPERDAGELKYNLTKYRRLAEWDSLYLVVLYIVYVDQSANRNRDKVQSVLKWMFDKFHLSIAGLAYSVVYFGQCPQKKMMKYKSTDCVEKRKKDLKNMTWDLFIIIQYFRKWAKKSAKTECLYASDDRAFRKILRLGIDVQIEGCLSPFSDYLSETVYREVDEIYKVGMTKDKESREYCTAEDPGAYRAALIAKIESHLGI